MCVSAAVNTGLSRGCGRQPWQLIIFLEEVARLLQSKAPGKGVKIIDRNQEERFKLDTPRGRFV